MLNHISFRRILLSIRNNWVFGGDKAKTYMKQTFLAYEEDKRSTHHKSPLLRSPDPKHEVHPPIKAGF